MIPGRPRDHLCRCCVLRPGDVPAGVVPERERLSERDGGGRGDPDPSGRGLHHAAVPHAAPQRHALLHQGERNRDYFHASAHCSETRGSGIYLPDKCRTVCGRSFVSFNVPVISGVASVNRAS